MNTQRDETYRTRIIAQLTQKLAGPRRPRKGSYGERNDNLMRELLERCKLPNTDAAEGAIEAYVLPGGEAEKAAEHSSYLQPIFTEGQQQFEWSDEFRPIRQFFDRIEDFDQEVSVQIPSRSVRGNSYQSRKLSQVCDRFLSNEETNDPWNLLDFRSPFPSLLSTEVSHGAELSALVSRARRGIDAGKR